MSPLLLQLADSAFPSGGFAHSAGLEALFTLRAGLSVEATLDAVLAQASTFALPFVRDAHGAGARLGDLGELARLDDLCDAMTSNHVARRASLAQARQLATAARGVFARSGVADLCDRAREPGLHLVTLFGALLALAGASADEACLLYAHQALRGALSSAVRLGACGPLEAQRLHADRHDSLEAAVRRARDVRADDAAQSSPVLEAFAGLHDELATRLFQS